MKLNLTVAIAAALMVSAAPAWAAPVDLTRASTGYTYFNRPGADLAVHDSELKACLLTAASVGQLQIGSNFGVAGAIYQGAIERRGFAANVENCMIVKGWRVVRLDPTEGEALAKADRLAQAETLKGWVGASEVHGEVVRAWGNDAAVGATVKYQGAGSLDKPSISVSAIADSPAPAKESREALPAMPKSAQPLKPLTAAQLAALPPDASVLVVRLGGAINSIGARFTRMGPTPETPAWAVDKKPADILLIVPLKFVVGAFDQRETTVAYAVEPGRWRLDGLAWGLQGGVSLCMGAPSFEVKPGEVVYTGGLDLAAPNIGPDMSMDPAQALLASAPHLAAKLRPAEWSNGSKGACTLNYVYALELKDVPFEDGADPAGGRP